MAALATGRLVAVQQVACMGATGCAWKCSERYTSMHVPRLPFERPTQRHARVQPSGLRRCWWQRLATPDAVWGLGCGHGDGHDALHCWAAARAVGCQRVPQQSGCPSSAVLSSAWSADLNRYNSIKMQGGTYLIWAAKKIILAACGSPVPELQSSPPTHTVMYWFWSERLLVCLLVCRNRRRVAQTTKQLKASSTWRFHTCTMEFK